MRERAPIVLVVVSILLSFVASPANASWIEVLIRYDDYCTSGALRACMSVHTQTITTDEGTEVLFSVRNLQGSHSADNTGGSALFMTVVSTNFSMGETGPTHSYGPVGQVELLGSPSFFISHSPDWISLGEEIDQSGVFGCDAPGPVDPSKFGSGHPEFFWKGAWRTCPGDGLDGWFTWNFSSTERFTALDLPFSVRGVTHDWRSFGCGFSGGESSCVPVPEPRGLVLMLTGALGLLFVGRRRGLRLPLREEAAEWLKPGRE